jgi:hypothetical protein
VRAVSVPGRHGHGPNTRAVLFGPSGRISKHGPARCACRAGPSYSLPCWVVLRAFKIGPCPCWSDGHGPNLEDYFAHSSSRPGKGARTLSSTYVCPILPVARSLAPPPRGSVRHGVQVQCTEADTCAATFRQTRRRSPSADCC